MIFVPKKIKIKKNFWSKKKKFWSKKKISKEKEIDSYISESSSNVN
jgi:hypothetical protein